MLTPSRLLSQNLTLRRSVGVYRPLKTGVAVSFFFFFFFLFWCFFSRIQHLFHFLLFNLHVNMNLLKSNMLLHWELHLWWNRMNKWLIILIRWMELAKKGQISNCSYHQPNRPLSLWLHLHHCQDKTGSLSHRLSDVVQIWQDCFLKISLILCPVSLSVLL